MTYSSQSLHYKYEEFGCRPQAYDCYKDFWHIDTHIHLGCFVLYLQNSSSRIHVATSLKYLCLALWRKSLLILVYQISFQT